MHPAVEAALVDKELSKFFKKLKPRTLEILDDQDVLMVIQENNELNPHKPKRYEVKWKCKADRLPFWFKKVRSRRNRYLVSLYERGLTMQEIADMMSLSKPTVYAVLKRYEREEND